MPTIRDVAIHAGVSISTVSHVINHTRFVDPETEERVRTSIQQLGYRPNSLARSLRRGTTNTIALIVPDISNPFFADLARAIEAAGFAEGYNVILCNSAGSAEKEEMYIRMLLSKQMDGFILVSSSSSPERIRILVEAEVPMVVLDRELGDHFPVDKILTDNEQGGYLAGQYFIQLGHRHIGCILGPADIILSADRLAGFRRALSEAGVELPDEAIAFGDFQYEGGQTAMAELLKRGHPLTAVFAANDLMAIGAIHSLHNAHLRVPQDISIIGFDNVLLSAIVSPSLTTIAQPIEEIGQQTISVLLKRIKQQTHAPTRILLPTVLIERESCCIHLQGKEVEQKREVTL